MQTTIAPSAYPSKPLPELVPSAHTPVEPVTPNEIALHAVAQKIGNCPQEALHLFNAYHAVRAIRQKFAADAAQTFIWQAANDVSKLTPHAAQGKIDAQFHNGHHAELAKFAAIDSGLRALEAEPGLADALALLNPLHAERERLQTLVLAERQARAEAHQHVIDMEHAAIEKAQLAALADPDLKLARERLAAFDSPEPSAPAALIRGKQKLPTDREPLEIDKLFGPEE